MSEAARRAAEAAARTAYGRLVALLASRAGDVASAEDALAEAFRQALETWPERGVPDRPEAWLLTAARREIGHAWRGRAVRRAGEETIALLADELAEREPGGFPDERLKLLFVCAHPAVAQAARTPLMLQAVLGLDAARIAGAFLVAPAAMGQLLTRAKRKIRDARVPFVVPERAELPERLEAVLAAVYAAFGAGWDDAVGADPKRKGLAEEALYLGRLVAALLPGEAEAHGLCALMLHCEARRAARRDEAGRFVPLAAQDPARWSASLTREAEAHLRRAAELAPPGRYALEAAIQSVHAERARTGLTNWRALAALYGLLAARAPTIGVLVARAAALGEAEGAAAGLAALEALPGAAVAAYQPFWAARAHLLAAAGEAGPARSAYERAMGLSEDPAVRAFLAARAAALGAASE